MAKDHIVKAFDQDLHRIDGIIAEMGRMAGALLAEALDALDRLDGRLAEEVITADHRLDELKRSMDQHVVRTLALRQPMAGDLRTVIAALRTAIMVERIGDYAKNIAKRTVALLQNPPHEVAFADLLRMGRLVQRMVRSVLEAYLERDADRAEQVRRSDEEVDTMHTTLFNDVLLRMAGNPRGITHCAHLLFVAKNVERIGDHATNIAEQVLFMVQGEVPGEDRPKGDASSFVVWPASASSGGGPESGESA